MNERLRTELEKYSKDRAMAMILSSEPDEWDGMEMDVMYDLFMECDDTPDGLMFFDEVDFWHDLHISTQQRLLQDKKDEMYTAIVGTYNIVKNFMKEEWGV